MARQSHRQRQRERSSCSRQLAPELIIEGACMLMVFGRVRSLRSPRTSVAQRGQGLAEYALILGMIAVAAIAAVTLLGTQINSLLWYISSFF
jgi:Flp pilus assembly pilin Flp